jgi:hypothetical protein
MARKIHLQHTVNHGPTCQTGRAGAGLRGEHITVKFDGFVTYAVARCDRCSSSKLFAFLQRRASKVAA